MYLFFIVLVTVLIIITILSLFRNSIMDAFRSKKKQKSRDQIIQEAHKRLSSNPRNVPALQTLSEMFFEDQNWKRSLEINGALNKLTATNHNQGTEKGIYQLRYGIAAFHLNMLTEAHTALLPVSHIKGIAFEANYYLGLAEYQQNNYEHAAAYLDNAIKIDPDHIDCLKHFAVSHYRLKHYKKAISVFQYLSEKLDDDEILFSLAQCYYHVGRNHPALTIFEQLKHNDIFGLQSAVISGCIYLNQQMFEKAKENFEISLQYPNLPPQTKLEMQYRLAITFTKLQQLHNANDLFQQVYNQDPNYKDVADRIRWASELAQNQYLQTYLLGKDAEFTAICRQFCALYFKNSTTKIMDIYVKKGHHVDIIVDVKTPHWSELTLFRFVKTTGIMGDLVLKDLNARMKEKRIVRGICVCAGSYSPVAQEFVLARLIDLVPKTKLLNVMGRLVKQQVNPT